MNIFIVLFAIYLIGMVLLAFKAKSKTSSTESFSVMKVQKPWAIALTFAGTFMCGATFVGVPAQYYSNGLSNLWYQPSQWFPCMITLCIVAPAFQKLSEKLGTLTVSEWLGKRYDSGFLKVLTALVSVSQVFYIASQLVICGIVFSQMLGWSYTTGVIVCGCILMFYLTLGGTYAHVYINTVQGIIMCCAVVFLILSGFYFFGNIFETIPAQLAAQSPDLIQPLSTTSVSHGSWLAVFGFYLQHLVWVLNPQLMKEMQCLKSPRDMKKFVLFTGAFLFIISLMQLVGLYARVTLGGGVVNADDVIPIYLQAVYPKAVASIICVVIMAAVMSTADGIMCYLATIMGDTLYRRTLVPYLRGRGRDISVEKADRVSFNICRFGVIFIGLLSIPLALRRPESQVYMITISGAVLLGCICGPIACGLFCRRTSKLAAILGSLGGIACFCIFYFGNVIPQLYLMNGMCGAMSILLTLLFSYILPPMDPIHVNEVLGPPKKAAR